MTLYNAAHTKAKLAEKAGVIVRPDKCECCRGNKELFRHHEDYNFPLDVSWLCFKCHTLRHTVKPSRIIYTDPKYQEQQQIRLKCRAAVVNKIIKTMCKRHKNPEACTETDREKCKKCFKCWIGPTLAEYDAIL